MTDSPKVERKKIAPLSDKQRAFITHYLQCLNATESARRAGYAGNDNTLSQIGHKLVRNGKIRAEIDRILSKQVMSAHEVLRRQTEIASLDVTDFFDFTGNLPMFKPDKAKERGVMHLIKSFKITNKEFKVEFYDAQRAQETLAKYHDLTNKVRVEDWRSQAVEDIRAGLIAFDALVKTFDEDLATELFTLAGVPINGTA